MYQLIIFDWDGTLMDSAQKISNCIRASARDVGLEEPTEQAAKSIIGLGLVEAMRLLFPGAKPAEVTALIESYKHHFVTADQTEQALFEGVEAGLETLSQSGALLAIATGKARAGMTRIFKEVAIEHHFVASRCADETRSKPHPQMLLELLEYTAIDPNKSLMVGDTTYDMEMAANAGIDGLAAGYGVHARADLLAANAVEVLNSFTQVSDWLLDSRLQKAYD